MIALKYKKTRIKNLILLNERDTKRAQIFLDEGWIVGSLDDKDIEKKLAEADYTFLSQFLSSKKATNLLNTYLFLQKLIEQDYEMKFVGVFAFHDSVRLSGENTEIIQDILQPEVLPKDSSVWVKRLEFAKGRSTREFRYVKERYLRKLEYQQKQTPKKIFAPIIQGAKKGVIRISKQIQRIAAIL